VENRKERGKDNARKTGRREISVLLAAIFVTYAGEDVKHFAQTVNQTRMMAITTGTMTTAKTRLFNSSNMVGSRKYECFIVTASAGKTRPICAVAGR
jgi:hypothetical protein